MHDFLGLVAVLGASQQATQGNGEARLSSLPKDFHQVQKRLNLVRFFLNLWKHSAVLSSEMNDKPTVPAPSEAPVSSEPPRLDMELASFELYAATVLADSERFYNCRKAIQ